MGKEFEASYEDVIAAWDNARHLSHAAMEAIEKLHAHINGLEEEIRTMMEIAHPYRQKSLIVVNPDAEGDQVFFYAESYPKIAAILNAGV